MHRLGCVAGCAAALVLGSASVTRTGWAVASPEPLAVAVKSGGDVFAYYLYGHRARLNGKPVAIKQGESLKGNGGISVTRVSSLDSGTVFRLTTAQGPAQADAPARPPSVETRATANDPVCGMAMEASSAAANATHQGTTHYFCSSTCQERFKAEPEMYTSPDQ